jgi:Tol biopolymer transport system component
VRLPTILLVLAGTLLPGVAGASADEGQRLLVLSGKTPGSDEIHWVSGSGGETKPLTRHSPQGVFPAWSPDGRTIAFTAVDGDDDDPQGIWLARPGGSAGARQLVALGAGEPVSAAWSPNSRSLAVTDSSTLWLVDARRETKRKLADVGGSFAHPAWAPDGRRIAFGSCPGRATCGLYVVDVQTRRLMRLTRRLTVEELDNEVDLAGTPAWSPDGKRIAAAKGDGESYEIVLVNSRHKGERVIGSGFQPVWVSSTLVATVAFSGEFNDHVRLLRIGGPVRRIGDPPGEEFALGWAPRARKLVFASYRSSSGRVALYQADPRGRGFSRLRRPVGRVRGSQEWSPRGNEVALDYYQRVGEAERVFLIAAQDINGRRRQLIQPARDVSAVASPDGTKIAFTRLANGSGSLHVMNADGSGERRLTRGGWPRWAPSGETIVFTRGGEIRAIAADGTRERRLAVGLDPTFSPDGRRVALGTSEGVVAVDIEGREQLLIARAARRECRPSTYGTAWSPDGQRIAFLVAYRLTTGDCLYAPDGVLQVADLRDGTSRGIYYGGAPRQWSRDGTQILVGGRDCTGCPVVVVRADGSGHRRLANGAEPVWSPDGRYVAFEREVNGGKGTDVWIVGTDGAGLRRITTGGASHSPSWLR